MRITRHAMRVATWAAGGLRAVMTALAVATLAVATALAAAPQAAWATDASEGSRYADELLNDGSEGTRRLTTDEWVDRTIWNTETTGYESLGTPLELLGRARSAMNGLLAVTLPTILVLFTAKVAGRGVYGILMRDEDQFRDIPTFFLNSKERADKKEPHKLEVQGGMFGGGGGMPNAERSYGPSYIDPHPYGQFARDFLAFVLVAVGVWFAISMLLGLAAMIIRATQDAGGLTGSAFERRRMFGVD